MQWKTTYNQIMKQIILLWHNEGIPISDVKHENNFILPKY